MDYRLIVGLMLYYALHSLLATDWIKSQIKTPYYRLFYTLFSLIGFVPVLSFIQLNWTDSTPAIGIAFLLFALGVRIMYKSFAAISLGTFLGFKPEGENQDLSTSGLYGFSRHPMYLGGIVLLLGLSILSPTRSVLIFCVITWIYILIGGHLEEKKLIHLYGEQYISYRSKTPFFFYAKQVKDFLREIF